MAPPSDAQQAAALAAARERGSITLEQIFALASGSPVDLGEARGLAQQASISSAHTHQNVHDRAVGPGR